MNKQANTLKNNIMKKTTLILAVFISIFSVSCKKDKLDSDCNIASITINDNPSFKSTFKYDNQNRISEYTEEGGAVVYKFEYTGLSGKLKLFLADTLYETKNLTFDSYGRLTSFEDYLPFGGDLLRYFYLFTYNSDGYLASTIQTLTGGSYDSYYRDSLIYSGGNLIKNFRKHRNNTIQTTTEFSYGSNTNKHWNFYWNAFTEPFSILSGYTFLYPLLGKTSTNLPTSVVVTEGSFIDNFSYAYFINSAGNATEYNEMRSNTVTGNTSSNYKLTYTCD